MSRFTPGPWSYEYEAALSGGGCWYTLKGPDSGDLFWHPYNGPRSGGEREEANARLAAAAPTQHVEMVRFLPIIERAEADPELWTRLTKGTGIATANAYRAAIAAATGEPV